MRITEYIKEKLDDAVSFIVRNLMWILLALFGLYLLGFQPAVLSTLLIIATIEGIALGLSGLALFVYTKINFTKYIMEGDDKKLSGTERYAIMTLLGNIFLGVHILIGLIVLGVYIAQFSN